MAFNLDKLQQQKATIQTALCAAIKEQDESKINAALESYSTFISEMVTTEATAGTNAFVDTGILSARGIRQLTQKETDYYTKFIAAAKGTDAKQAIANITESIPETVIDTVMADIKKSHKLLELIEFKNTTGITKVVYDKSGTTEATWGDLGKTTSDTISGTLGVFDAVACKMFGTIVIPNDVLDLGAAWVDQYVRELLTEYVAAGAETAAIYGDGNKKPIGMARSVADDVTVSGGVYPLKTAIVLTEITPTSIGAILAGIAKAPGSTTEKPIARAVTNVILIVNPFDYFTKVMPATTIRTANGTYVNDVMPYPCTIIQSAAIPANSAVIGMAKRYLFTVGFTKRAAIELDDSCKFDEDARVYRTKLLANGRALDDNAFKLLDITNLVPKDLNVVIANADAISVTVDNTTTAPVNTKEVPAG